MQCLWTWKLAHLTLSTAEHNIKEEAETKTRRRPDLSSFYSAVEAVDTSHTTNDHADPTPGDLSGVYRMLADGLRQLEGRAGNPSELVQEMISVLMGEAEEPPRRVNGVSDSFMAGKFVQGGWIEKHLQSAEAMLS